MQLHGSSRFSGQRRTGHIPFINGKLRSKTSPDEVTLDRDVFRVHAQRLGHLAGRSRNVLRRELDVELIFAVPATGRAVRFEAAVRDGVDSVIAGMLDVGIFDRGIGIAFHGFAATAGKTAFNSLGQVELVDKVIEQLRTRS